MIDTVGAIIAALKKYPRISGILLGIIMHPVFSVFITR